MHRTPRSAADYRGAMLAGWPMEPDWQSDAVHGAAPFVGVPGGSGSPRQEPIAPWLRLVEGRAAEKAGGFGHRETARSAALGSANPSNGNV
jgi:hypothetical protein